MEKCPKMSQLLGAVLLFEAELDLSNFIVLIGFSFPLGAEGTWIQVSQHHA